MMTEKRSAEKAVRGIRRRTRKKYSAEEKIRILFLGQNQYIHAITDKKLRYLPAEILANSGQTH